MCLKTSYLTFGEVSEAKTEAEATRGMPLRVYRCTCDAWHLTSQVVRGEPAVKGQRQLAFEREREEALALGLQRRRARQRHPRYR